MMMRACLAAVVAIWGSQSMAQLEAVPGNHWNQGGTVYVSCYRGPWTDVIWDRPEAIFVDSLVSVGYDYTNALAIATRVCRDITLVGSNAALKAEMERIINQSPRP